MAIQKSVLGNSNVIVLAGGQGSVVAYSLLLPVFYTEFFLTRLCANKKDAYAFGEARYHLAP